MSMFKWQAVTTRSVLSRCHNQVSWNEAASDISHGPKMLYYDKSSKKEEILISLL
jgi:hypothetical protein